jgi:hypothetical protein
VENSGDCNPISGAPNEKSVDELNSLGLDDDIAAAPSCPSLLIMKLLESINRSTQLAKQVSLFPSNLVEILGAHNSRIETVVFDFLVR